MLLNCSFLKFVMLVPVFHVDMRTCDHMSGLNKHHLIIVQGKGVGGV